MSELRKEKKEDFDVSIIKATTTTLSLEAAQVKDFQESGQLRREIERANKDHRENYVKKVYRLVYCWLIGLALIIVLDGFTRFELPTGVLITLVSTTTLPVIGLLTLIIKYLFKH